MRRDTPTFTTALVAIMAIVAVCVGGVTMDILHPAQPSTAVCETR